MKGRQVRHRILKAYLAYLLVGTLVPLVLYLTDHTVPMVDLFRCYLLFPLHMLALEGVKAAFPAAGPGNVSLRRTAEFALLQGLVFSTSMTLFAGFDPSDHADLRHALIRFAGLTLTICALAVLVAILVRKNPWARERAPEA